MEYFQRDRLGLKEGDVQERKVKCEEIDGGPEGTRDPNMYVFQIDQSINIFDLLTPVDMHRIYSEASPSLRPPPFPKYVPPASEFEAGFQPTESHSTNIRNNMRVPNPVSAVDCLEYLAPRTRSSYHSSVRMPVCAFFLQAVFMASSGLASRPLRWLADGNLYTAWLFSLFFATRIVRREFARCIFHVLVANSTPPHSLFHGDMI